MHETSESVSAVVNDLHDFTGESVSTVVYDLCEFGR